MKPRNREINIFNISLLDILCGALGTFCFMMLVLFPYYRPNSARQPPPDEKSVDGKAYTEALTKAQKQIQNLEMRTPVVISAAFDGPNDMDVFVEDDAISSDGKSRAPRINPVQKQNVYWPGDRRVDCTRGPCTELWVIRDVPAGEYRVYFKLLKKGGDADTVVFDSAILPSLDEPVYLPRVTLSSQGQVLRVATITSKPDHHVTIRVEAQQAQQQKQ